jgi:hypothetical protein
METENDYLKTVNEMKEQFDLKDLEVENEKKKSEFFTNACAIRPTRSGARDDEAPMLELAEAEVNFNP